MVFKAFRFQNCRKGSVNLDDKGGGEALVRTLERACQCREDQAVVSLQGGGEGRKQAIRCFGDRRDPDTWTVGNCQG